MGDFWGVELVQPRFYSKKGVSCCIINTKKGKSFFEKIKERFYHIETTPEKITKKNENLLHPTKKPYVREYIYHGIDDLPIENYIRKLYAPLNKRCLRFLISKIPHGLKIMIKRILYGF